MIKFGGPNVVSPLIGLLNDNNTEVVCRATIALGELRDKSATISICNILGKRYCVGYCLNALEKIGDKAALSHLKDFLRRLRAGLSEVEGIKEDYWTSCFDEGNYEPDRISETSALISKLEKLR